MNSLALLCNLHADGPLTLQRLRRLGCESLPALLDLDAGVLGEELGADEAAAERFQREAALLYARVEGEAAQDEWDEEDDWEEELEEEDADEDELVYETDQRVVVELVDEIDPDDEDDDEDDEEEELQGGYEEPADVGSVLKTWRSLDHTAPPEAPKPFLVPRPSQDPLDNVGLEEAQLEGLTPELAAHLGDAGVLSLRGLAEASTMRLAEQLPLPFTRVRRLQFLARRALDGMREAEDPAAPADDDSRLDSAGPFA